jgi:hypothetical protein
VSVFAFAAYHCSPFKVGADEHGGEDRELPQIKLLGQFVRFKRNSPGRRPRTRRSQCLIFHPLETAVDVR